MGSKLYVVLAVLAFSAGAVQAQTIDTTLIEKGDAVHGEVLFNQRCKVCHLPPEPGGKNAIGPELYNAYGHKAGQAPGFTYSPGVPASGIVWTPDKLNQWVQKPSALIPGAKMMLAPISAPQDRADIIAYLKTKSTVTDAPAVADKPAKKKSAKKS